MLDSVLNPHLHALRAAFVRKGFDVRLVGGAVRDLQDNVKPKDIDLCTDADPDEQIRVYKDAGFRYAETGLQHGTITVVLGGVPYEITSLRTESDHDGRHATVAYTRDWIEDLSRRDLTINAMAMTFDGALIDPFGGQDDLKRKLVRFVGNPDDRMREDYLRILRWIRFHARLAGRTPLHKETWEAAKRHREGLRQISRERVWSEMQRIVIGPSAPEMLRAIMSMGLSGPMDMPHGSVLEANAVADQTSDPVAVLVAFIRDPSLVRSVAASWKWSRADTDRAEFLADRLHDDTLDLFRLLAHDGHPREWVIELATIQHRFDEVCGLEDWDIPVFPVQGADLLAAGMKPGKEVGERLRRLKQAWTDSGYSASKDDLLRI